MPRARTRLRALLVSSIAFDCRQPEREGRALPRGALAPDFATQFIHEAFRDGESVAAGGLACGRHGPDADARKKQAGLFLRTQARPFVPDAAHGASPLGV